MSINIIIKDHRSKQQKEKAHFAEEVMKGYYHCECDGSYKSQGHKKSNIKKAWESFEHDTDVDKYPADGGLPE
jgi:hypothetical protein